MVVVVVEGRSWFLATILSRLFRRLPACRTAGCNRRLLTLVALTFCISVVLWFGGSDGVIPANVRADLDSAGSSSIDAMSVGVRESRRRNLSGAAVLFRKRPLVMLTLSYHATPIYDLIDQLEPLGVKIIERGLNSYGCRYFNTCRQTDPLLVVSWDTVHYGVSSSQISDFYNAYRNDPDFKSVDAFICLYPIATCELFIPFNKTIIVLTTGRYDFGRRTVKFWKYWNGKLIRLAADPKNVVAANNLFDVEYMRYFTGLTPRLLPSRCAYTGTSYNPTRPGFLLGLRRDWKFREFFIRKLNAACLSLNVTVRLASTRDLYPRYHWSDLASHRGIVPLPSQASMMGILEQYRMNIPLFLPSKSLLLDFQLGEHMMLNSIYSHQPGDTLPPHPSQSFVPDPTVHLATSIRYWIQFCDWYTEILPHVVLYNSMEDLVMKLNSTTLEQLTEVSRRMAQHNEKVERQLDVDWKEILLKVAKNSPNHPH